MGDSKTGKTSLLCALKDGKLAADRQMPETVNTFTQKIKVDGRKLELGLWDSSGDPKYEGLRRLSYPSCNVFVVCYSVNCRDSFENISKVWLPELQKFGPPKASVVIVATKRDLRPRNSLIRNVPTETSQPQNGYVNYDEGLKLANEVHAFSFLECSAISEDGVSDVFAQATRAVLKGLKDEKAKNKERRGSAGIRSMFPGK